MCLMYALKHNCVIGYCKMEAGDYNQINCCPKTYNLETVEEITKESETLLCKSLSSLAIDSTTYDDKNKLIRYSCTDLITNNESNCLTTISADKLSHHAEFLRITDQFFSKLCSDGNYSRRFFLQKKKLLRLLEDQIEKSATLAEENIEQQLRLCQRQQKKCFKLIKDISIRLRDHKCIGATDPINPVFILLEDVRFLVHEIIHSANVLGIMKYENCMAKSWNAFSDYFKKFNINSHESQGSKRLNTNTCKMSKCKTRVSPMNVTANDFRHRYIPTCMTNIRKVSRILKFISCLCIFVLGIIYWYCVDFIESMKWMILNHI